MQLHPVSDDSVRLTYFIYVNNIGDRVSPDIVSSLTGRSTRWNSDVSLPHLLAIGSLIASAAPSTYIWGAGILHPTMGLGEADPEKVLAVRGKLTYEEFIRCDRRLRDIPLGDPGFLVARVLGLKRDPDPIYDVGVIPHYVDRGHPFVEWIRHQDGVLVLDVTEPPSRFFKQLASCRNILSSSLHGLIFAEALGTPNVWMELSDKVLGEGFKFRDWFSLAQRPQYNPCRPRVGDSISVLKSYCELHNISVDAPALEAALTEKVIEAVSGPAIGSGVASLARRLFSGKRSIN